MTSSLSTGAPTTAERIRSTCAREGGAMLAVEGIDPTSTPVHHLLDTGSLVTTVPAGGPTAAMVTSAADSGLQAMLELTDCAPLPLREPVRSLVWIRGRLRHVPEKEVPALRDLINGSGLDPRHALTRLEVESVVVADSSGAESVTPQALMSARPDPFCTIESCWLQHLESDHRDVIERLAGRVPPSLRRGRVWPLGLDRCGVQLRVEGPDGDHDVRLPFNRPVNDVTSLSQAIRVLMGCPFLNGLRARRA